MGIKEAIQQNLNQMHMKKFSSLDYALTHLKNQDLEKFFEDTTSQLKGEDKTRALAFLSARRSDLMLLKE